MNSKRGYLEESRDSWQECAKHDKKQFLASFVMAATGTTLAGVGIGIMLKGDIAGGAIDFAVGTGIAVPSVKMGLDEIQDFADMSAQTAVRQCQIDELTEE